MMRSLFCRMGRLSTFFAFFISSLCAQEIKSAAFYYGDKIPSEFNAFDAVIMEAGNFKNASETKIKKEKLFAYVSMGEVVESRPYFQALPKNWLVGKNEIWKSALIDQSDPQWPSFFVEKIIKPLKEQGYNNFFFDTMDSYQLIAKRPKERAVQEAGMIAAVKLLKKTYPDTKIILNRGFEVLPELYPLVECVAAESLFGRWNEMQKEYTEVAQDEHKWLLAEMNKVKNVYKLPVISIEYVKPSERKKAREIAKKVKNLGFIPYVTNGALDMVGISAIEVQPRRVLMIYDKKSYSLPFNNIHQYAAMPLNYLGYKTDYADIGELPQNELIGLYAGIVTWLSEGIIENDDEYEAWLQKHINGGLPVAVLDYFGFNPESIPSMGVKPITEQYADVRKFDIEKIDNTLIGFELKVKTNLAHHELHSLQKENATKEILSLKAKNKETISQAAITNWGGYALYPNVLYSTIENENIPKYQGWILNPLEFFKSALRLEPFPAPDTTSENGKRLLFVHVDGDSFVSQIEFDDGRLAGQKMYEDVFLKYKIPQTVSIIEAETAVHGLYPKFSQEAEHWAREIYKLPYVEAAGHTFSHPFFWHAVEGGTMEKEDETLYGVNLKIPGYTFNFEREISGVADYMGKKLLPNDKRVKVVLWSGDCIVGEQPLAIARENALLAMNGGYTMMTKAKKSTTLLAPLGRPEGEEFQVYASNQNDNVYTNNWTGPFYGYEKAIETFELTDKPHRYKPINIYYHFYSATKKASLNALHKVYRWSLAQEVFPIYGSEYIQKVHGFKTINLSKEEDSWRITDNGALKEVKVPKALGYPDMEKSRGISGYSDHNDYRYIHITSENNLLSLTQRKPKTAYIQSVNGYVENFSYKNGVMEFDLYGHTPIELTLSNAHTCILKADGKKVSPQSRGETLRYSLPSDKRMKINVVCN